MALYDDLDAGDETGRSGDETAFPHPDTEGDALSGVTIPRGRVVAYDGTDLAEVTGDNSDAPAGVLANYDVYGDTGQEKIGAEATVKVRGEVKADLTAYAGGTATVAVGSSLGANGEIYVEEAIDASNNLYLVQVR
jgi:hypothetical protein